MKENKDIDKLLRASLESFRPAPDVSGREKFLHNAEGILPRKGRPFSGWKLFSASFALLVITGILVWYLMPARQTGSLQPEQSDPGTTPKGDLILNNTESIESTGQAFTTSNQNATKPGINRSFSIQENTPDSLTDKSYRSSAKTVLPQKAGPSEMPASPAGPEAKYDEPGMIRTAESTAVTPVILPSKQDDMAQKVSPQETMLQDSVNVAAELSPGQYTAPMQETLPAAGDAAQIERQKGGIRMFGIFYTPEKLYNAAGTGSVMHSVGLEFQYRPFHPAYVIRAGAGITVSPGYYDYGINYNEYLGTYQHLDSVTFTLAADQFHLSPTYHQTETEVFDSVIQTEFLTTDKRFEYLYVPVTVGYDLVRKDHVTFGVRAGPALSVLLNKKQKEPGFELGRNRLVAVDLITPERKTLIWKVTAGVSLTYIGHDNYFIELEPAFNWYFGQVGQESGSKKNPYSIGFRLAAGIIPGKTEVKK